MNNFVRSDLVPKTRTIPDPDPAKKSRIQLDQLDPLPLE